MLKDKWFIGKKSGSYRKVDREYIKGGRCMGVMENLNSSAEYQD